MSKTAFLDSNQLYKKYFARICFSESSKSCADNGTFFFIYFFNLLKKELSSEIKCLFNGLQGEEEDP